MPTVDMERFERDLAAAPIIAILRGVTPDTVIEVCEALVESGVRFIETPLNSPDPIESIRRAAERFGPKASAAAPSGAPPTAAIHIGAGTVLKPDDVDRVAEAGGTYIVSPNFNAQVVRRTKELGLFSIPGFFTPSEAFAAIEAGADYLKCFPARALGPGYLKDLRAVCPNPLVAVGGVDLANVRDYLAVAAAVGIGSALYSPTKTIDDIRQAAAAYVARAKGSA